MTEEQIAELQALIDKTVGGCFGHFSVKINPHKGRYLISLRGTYVDQDNIQDCFKFLSAFFLKASVLPTESIFPADPDA